MFKKLFLPLGLLFAMGMACLAPAPGAWLRAHFGVQIFVMIIFLMNGWTARWGGGHFNRRFVMALFAASALSLACGPWLGLWVSRDLLRLTGESAAGMIVMASVPVTLSSAIVMTAVAGGSHVWALLMTMGMNLVGIFTVPAMLKLCMPEGGAVRISVLGLLTKLTMLVLAPFVVGVIAQRLLRWKMSRRLNDVPSLCVILTVYASFAASRDDLLAAEPRLVPLLVLAALLTHFALFVLANGIARLLRQTLSERKAFCFVSSQKSLPIAVSVLAALSMNSALALLPCLVFHFGQLVLDSWIAAQWGHRCDPIA